MTDARAGIGIGLAALLVLTMGAGLALQSSGAGTGFVALVCLQAVLYGGVVAIVLRHGVARRVLVAGLAAAALMRAIVVLAPPVMSDDVYRYVWDGRVQSAGINPYRYMPGDPALDSLRDPTIYPNINRKDYAPTIYPPGAQAIFLAITRLSESVVAMKLAMVGFEVAAVLLLFAMLRRAGLPEARVLIYALHPLPVWEFAGSGHVDAAMIALMTLALWLHQRGGRWSTGVALAATCLIKPFPLALAPALWRRWDWRLPAAFALTVAVFYAPYLGVGPRVLGFLPTYLQEEGLQSGTAFYPLWLLRALLPIGVPTGVYVAAVVIVLAALAAGVVLRRDSGPSWPAALMLASALLFLISPHFPWYVIWLLPLACLVPWLPALYLVSASVLLYLPVEFALVGSITYGVAAILALIAWWRPSFLPSLEKRDAIGCAR
ncbi:MAG: DUF2029 domain-containing protein [Proteobacteria bacterium]|nr:DUF2029 domain-containing protein [Pseudomonadota bacterium]